MIKNHFIIFLLLFASGSTLFAQAQKVYEIDSKELIKKPVPTVEFLSWLESNNEKIGQKAPYSSKKGTKVTLVFEINEDGNLIAPKIWRGIGQGYDEYAWNLIKENPHGWVAGETSSGKVSTTVYFQLDYMKNRNRVVTKENKPIN